jgi:hypothetical protein
MGWPSPASTACAGAPRYRAPTKSPATRCCQQCSLREWCIGNALVANPLWTGVTFGIVLAGLPVYYAFFATKHPKTN